MNRGLRFIEGFARGVTRVRGDEPMGRVWAGSTV